MPKKMNKMVRAGKTAANNQFVTEAFGKRSKIESKRNGSEREEKNGGTLRTITELYIQCNPKPSTLDLDDDAATSRRV